MDVMDSIQEKLHDLLIREMKRGNGIISEQDLKDYRSVSRVPLTADYKGYKIITVPPPSGGGIILIQLLEDDRSLSVQGMGFQFLSDNSSYDRS